MSEIQRADLDTALATTSRGPHPPPLDRLRAAAEYVIGRTARPAHPVRLRVRGEFRADSNFDFLALGARTAPDTTSTRWTHPDTADEMDVLFDDAEHAPVRRWRAGTVHAAIFADGATVFVAPGTETVPTLRIRASKRRSG